VDRVAIVDTDCHHGDGTQDIYWHDPDTLFISIHQDGRTLYPGSGFLNEMGGPNAVGTTVNIPLPPHTSNEGFLYAIQDLVLPILEEFKPQLIVNSAGQDNHYSDPITNMNFSARGYADLTALLKADIAVLEGGYAIEGALPYVNTGIILAMAGVDYSHLREPDYDPQRFRQSESTNHWIKQTGARVLENWHQRESLARALRSKSGCQQRNRRIFYDTDNIYETQDETIRLCEDCAGALRIDSSSDRGLRILAVHIPRKACAACRKQGQNWYDTADEKLFNFIFMQDRTDDRYVGREGSR
jgi:Histone deacetylase domain